MELIADIDDLSKNIFMAALFAARSRMGSGAGAKLARALGLLPRRCDIWVAKGVMPLYPLMQAVYPRLVEIASMSDAEVECLITLGWKKNGRKSGGKKNGRKK